MTGRELFISALISILLWHAPSSAKDSPKLEKHRIETRLHRQRLPIVAINFVKDHPDEFPYSFENLDFVKKYFEVVHDYKKDEILVQLVEFYGEAEEEMTTDRLKNFEALRHFFNSAEVRRGDMFFNEYGFESTHPFRAELKILETILDVTDTGIYRLPEFGVRVHEPFDGARYLKNKLKMDDRWVDLSRALEMNYSRYLGEFLSHVSICSDALAGT
jgi:hypothetical protein